MDNLIWAVESAFFRNFIVLVGVLVAVISIRSARVTARKKQSADLLFASRNDELLQDGQRKIREYHNAKDMNIRALADLGGDDPNVRSIRYLLNHLETMSAGIRCGIYDEDMIKKCWCNIVVDVFEKSEPLIKAIREKVDKKTPLQEFEWLARRWKRKPLKARKQA